MISALNHITLAVTNIEKSFIFYHDVLGFTPLVKWDNGAYFLIKDPKSMTSEHETWFCLNVDKTRQPHSCYTHYAFSVTPDDFAKMTQKILLSGAIIFKENASPGESLYFLDPDGHKLEIHANDWQSRIHVKKTNPGSWKDIEWFV